MQQLKWKIGHWEWGIGDGMIRREGEEWETRGQGDKMLPLQVV